MVDGWLDLFGSFQSHSNPPTDRLHTVIASFAKAWWTDALTCLAISSHTRTPPPTDRSHTVIASFAARSLLYIVLYRCHYISLYHWRY